MASDSYEYEDVGGVLFVKDLPDRELAYRNIGSRGEWPGMWLPANRTRWKEMNIDMQLATLSAYADAVATAGDSRFVSRALLVAKRTLGLLDASPQLSDEADKLLRGKRLATAVGKLAAHREREPTLELYAKIAGPPFDGGHDWLDDATLGYLRVAGMNPVLVRQTEEPEVVRACAELEKIEALLSGKLDEALKDGRIYVVDEDAFAPLADIRECTDVEHPHAQRFVSRPTAVFLRNDSGHLEPLAIRCAPRLATITRDEGERWMRAKLHFSVAESLSQTYVTHQPTTHLLLEALTIATRRVEQRVGPHAVASFLKPHLEGTLAVNRVARRTLLSVDSPFADFIGFDSASANAVMLKSYLNAKKHLRTLDETLPPSDSSLVYPFRDDARALGECLSTWAKDFVTEHVPAIDEWVKAWADELATAAKIHVGEPIESPQQLAVVLGRIARIASVQHAALHYPQTDLGRHAALTPFYAADVPPGWRRDEDAKVRLLDSLPDLHAAAWQAFVLSQSRFVWRPLTKLLEHEALARLVPPEARTRFEAGLEAVDGAIVERNEDLRAAGLPEYVYLRPASVPCSVNV